MDHVRKQPYRNELVANTHHDLENESDQNPMPIVGNLRNEERRHRIMMRLKVMAATAQSPNYKCKITS
jgi:hypothetical protein